MNLTSTSILGCTLTPGSLASGSRYASHIQRRPRSNCWMTIYCSNDFPQVPSLTASMIQRRCDFISSMNHNSSTTEIKATKEKEKEKSEGPTFTTIHLEFELFDEAAPRACANFRQLCAGQSSSRQGQTYIYQGLTPSYRGTYFHKIIPHLCVQGGDLTMRVDGGANHFSSFGRGWFSDENKKRRINEVGLLLMANNGPNSNGSQFFITTSNSEEKTLNGRHVCFGRVSRGLQEFLKEVAPFGDINGYPSRFIIIEDCGVGVLPETLGSINGNSSYYINNNNNSNSNVGLTGEKQEEKEGKKETIKSLGGYDNIATSNTEKLLSADQTIGVGSEHKAARVTFKE